MRATDVSPSKNISQVLERNKIQSDKSTKRQTFLKHIDSKHGRS